MTYDVKMVIRVDADDQAGAITEALRQLRGGTTLPDNCVTAVDQVGTSVRPDTRRVYIMSRSMKDIAGLVMTIHAAVIGSTGRTDGRPVDPAETEIVIVHVTSPDDGLSKAPPALREITTAVEKTFAPAPPEKSTAFRLSYRNIQTAGAKSVEGAENAINALASEINVQNNSVLLLNLMSPGDGMWPENQLIYGQINAGKCIPYAYWPDTDNVRQWQQWAKSIGKPVDIIKCQWLTRARAMYMPFKQKLNGALGLIPAE